MSWKIGDYPWIKWLGLFAGPLIFIIVLSLATPQGMGSDAQAVMACTLWIAIWWISEAIPIPVTSLLPIILFPLTDALDLENTTAAYGNPIIFLFLGGFMVALAMEKWSLHKRIALNIILKVGTDQRMIVLGFMIATAFLSMWISNTATAMMMLPIGVALVIQLTDFEEKDQQKTNNRFGKVLMLGIAYAASIGGMATLVGTPTNAVLVAIVNQLYDVEISFALWMLAGFPIAVVLLFCCWYYMVGVAFPLPKTQAGAGKQEIQEQLRVLGPISAEEKWVTAVFIFTAFAWITRSFFLSPFLPAVDDSMIALTAGLALFIIPARSLGYKHSLLSWDIAKRLPWGILLLFGGGLAIATGFRESGLATFIGSQLTLLQGVGLFVILLSIVALINFLTEITSNVATATMMLPIVASLAVAIDVHPFGPMVAASLAASCAFMLPVATPPNAVVYGSGYIKMKDMVKTGFWLNIISIIIVTLFVYFILPIIWDLELQKTPQNFQ